MKTKLEMAHEYALQLSKNPSVTATHNDKDIASRAWAYADAMQAEADKREEEKQSKHVFETIEEWQPDWSQAPEWANWWAMDADRDCYWFENKPETMSVTWLPFDASDVKPTPSFGYTGDWRESLRKRPE